MDELIFLQDLAMVMAVSAGIMIVCQRFRLPVVLGYVIAGVVIGPHTPPFPLIKDLHSIHTLSELGVIFLLFSIGLEFSLSKLMKVGLVAFFAATLEIILMMGIGYGLGRVFGWKFMDSLFLGAILSISSTTIIAKVLMETKKIKEKFAQVILGILVIEDLLAIVIIALLSGVAATGSLEWKEIGISVLRVIGFVSGVLILGYLLVPRLLRYLAKFENDEMTVITVLGLCFGVSLAAAKFGFSVALGAFLIGAVIAETPSIQKIIHKIEPIRDMFTAIFFVSVGMLLSPQIVAQFWLPILIITLVTIGGKIFSCTFGTFLTGYAPDTALKVGLGLAQIGEFSFIIARLGENTGVTSPFLYPIAVSVSGITTLTTPFLMNNASAITRFLERIMPRPVATVLGLYTGWFQRLSLHTERKAAIWRTAKPFLPWLFFYTVFSSLVFYAATHFQERLHYLPAAAIALVVFISGILLWGSMRKVHEQIERTVVGIFELEKPREKTKLEAHNELFRLIREEYPWDVNTQDFLLPYQQSAVNQSLRDLRLRSETGVSIVAIYRDEESIPNPSPETTLLPGDVLLLMGDATQIKAAVKFLNQKMKEPVEKTKTEGEAKTEPFAIPEGSILAGKTLREIRLRRKSGVSVLGIQKIGLMVSNPDPDTVLEEGDTLVLFGHAEQIETAIRYLRSL